MSFEHLIEDEIFDVRVSGTWVEEEKATWGYAGGSPPVPAHMEDVKVELFLGLEKGAKTGKPVKVWLDITDSLPAGKLKEYVRIAIDASMEYSGPDSNADLI